MADPVYEGRSTVVNTTSTSVTSGTVTFSSLSADDLVLVIVQRESYNGITGVTCGGNAMTQLMVTGTALGQDFECGIWAIKAPSGGTNVDVVASFSTSDNWLSMVAFRWSNVNSATPLQSACNETGCDELSGPATSQTLLSITTSQRALIVALGTDYDNYNTHTAQNSYTKRFDNAVAGGGSSSVQWAFDKVADSGTYGGAGETISTAASDRWLGAIFAFEPTGGATLKTGSDTPTASVTEGKTLSSTSTRTDTPTVSVTDASTLLGTSDVSDTPTLSLTESGSVLPQDPEVAKSGSDTPSVGVTDSGTITARFFGASDTPTLSLVEAAGIASTSQIADPPTISVGELAAILSTLSRADTPTLSLTESSVKAVFVTKSGSDTVTVGVDNTAPSTVTEVEFWTNAPNANALSWQQESGGSGVGWNTETPKTPIWSDS